MESLISHSLTFFNNATANLFQQADESVLGSDNFFEKIIPNGWILAAHVLSAISVVAIILFLIWHPTRIYMQKRRKLFNQNLKATEDHRAEASRDLAEIKQQKLEVQKTISELMFQSQKDAEKITNQAVNSALEKAQRIQEKAALEVETLKKNAQAKINASVSDLAVEIAEKIINEKVNNEINQRFIDEYLNSLN
ncbi:F0F1 ATP synthase, F0 complex subunit B [[Mycoplasma] cavipharyngis]|uniref:F0F1 ATP synthase subunit B family protein n=1 Tax=[Mycoplasma] cavipharyngis TaxID=92757 RepID=UPI0037037424